MLSHFAGIFDGIIGIASFGFLYSDLNIRCARMFLDAMYGTPSDHCSDDNDDSLYSDSFWAERV